MYEWIPFSRQLRLGDALCPVGGYEMRIIDPNDSKMVQRDGERNNPIRGRRCHHYLKRWSTTRDL
jgi:hypothetical protein